MISLILLAAGSGTRFGRKKQFVELLGKPLFLYSVEKTLGLFDETLLVLPREDLEKVDVPKGIKKVAGGKERQDSVFNALLQSKGDVVVIHDCARPFATKDMFIRVANLGGYDGKIVAIPVRDTLKQVINLQVIKTVDRSNLYHSQTPQAFKRNILYRAHLKAREMGIIVTDDAMLLEMQGYKVGVAEGSPTNIKITYPEDILYAECLLMAMKKTMEESKPSPKE